MHYAYAVCVYIYLEDRVREEGDGDDVSGSGVTNIDDEVTFRDAVKVNVDLDVALLSQTRTSL